jgi:ATP-dependent protease ClpP protease subunit
MRYQIKAQGPRALNLEICEEIWKGSEFSAAEIRRRIAKADVDLIQVRINSIGGDVDEGLDIYHSLVSHPARVEVMITGIAASIASVIACAGDHVKMSDAAQYMIHNPWTEVMGDADKMSQAADALQSAQVGLAKIYAARSAKPFETILDMMKKETYLSASDAKSLGFVDEIVPVKATNRELASLPVEQLNAPSAFRDLVIYARKQNMDPQILTSLGLGEDATLEDVIKAIMSLRETMTAPAEKPEPAAAEPPPDDPDKEQEVMSAIGRLGPNMQAAILAWRTKAMSPKPKADPEHVGLVAKLPPALRAWGAVQSVATIKGYLARVGEAPEVEDREPARVEAFKDKDQMTEAQLAVAKACGLKKVK